MRGGARVVSWMHLFFERTKVTARFKHLITEISKQHPNDMKFTTIIGVAATLLGVAFTSSAEAEKIGAEIAALRGKVSGKMESVSIYFEPGFIIYMY